jgi:hypothetical protein
MRLFAPSLPLSKRCLSLPGDVQITCPFRNWSVSFGPKVAHFLGAKEGKGRRGGASVGGAREGIPGDSAAADQVPGGAEAGEGMQRSCKDGVGIRGEWIQRLELSWAARCHDTVCQVGKRNGGRQTLAREQ